MTRLNWIATGAGIILGLVFLAAGLGKMLNPGSSILFVFPEFLPAGLDEFIFLWLPRIEVVLGLLLLVGVAARLVATLVLTLTAGMVANNSILLVQGLGEEPCGCFGQAERLTQLNLSVTGALYIDAAMLALGFMVLLFYGGTYFNINPWFSRRG
jgi:uncharacterized membrane protein YphA (DoxX/SURF4 family)